MQWTHPMCEACWVNERGTWERLPDGSGEYLSALRMPVLLRRDDPKVEQCAYCGRPTFVGLFVRADPTTLPFPAKEDEG